MPSIHLTHQLIKFLIITVLLSFFSINLSANTLNQNEILELLKNPSERYFLLMRHALAPGGGDPLDFDVNDCSTQRNLSQTGREQAREVGQIFRDNNIQFSEVLSSQWCRCLETAENLNLGEVQPFEPLNSFFGDYSKRDERIAGVMEFLTNHRKNPGVTMMVTHFVTISNLTGRGLSSGDIAVIKMNESNQIELLGRLSLID